jgi:hypothetical protein
MLIALGRVINVRFYLARLENAPYRWRFSVRTPFWVLYAYLRTGFVTRGLL